MKSSAPQAANDKAPAKIEDNNISSGIEPTLGEIKIHDSVFASLARKATLSVEGVSRLSGNAFVDNIAEIVGSKRMQARALTVQVDELNRVMIEIKINILLGYNIPEVAEKVQNCVIDSVENVTGMTVGAVNVIVQDVEDPADLAAEAAEDAETAILD